jgi:hypothetical protein
MWFCVWPLTRCPQNEKVSPKELVAPNVRINWHGKALRRCHPRCGAAPLVSFFLLSLPSCRENLKAGPALTFWQGVKGGGRNRSRKPLCSIRRGARVALAVEVARKVSVETDMARIAERSWRHDRIHRRGLA